MPEPGPGKERADPLCGFQGREALRHLLAAWGKPAGPRSASEEAWEAGGQDALVAELERHGILARWTLLQPSDLPSLHLPTLTLRDDGSYWLVTGWNRGRLVMHGPGGPSLLDKAVGSYLDLAPSLPSGTLWQRILKLLPAQRRTLASIAGAALLAYGLTLTTPQLTRVMVDHAFPRGAHSMLYLVLTASTLAALYRAWLGWLQGRLELFLETRLGFELELGLFAHLLRLPYGWISGRGVGDLLQGFYGMGSARRFLTGQMFSTLLAGVTAACSLVLMAMILPGAAAWVAAATLACLGMTLATGQWLAVLQDESTSAQIRERGLLVELLNGMAVIKATGAAGHMQARWSKLFRRRSGLDLMTRRFNLASTSLQGVVQSTILQVLTVWGGYQVLQGGLGLGDMLAVIMMAGSFQQAVAQVGNLYLQWVLIKPQLAKAREILETRPLPAPPIQEPGTSLGPLRICNLSFRYRPDGPWVLRNLSLEIAPGERVVLRGRSGCGKSTLLKVLADLNVAQEGSIFFGDRAPAQAKATVAYLPQFIQLFNGSILENLRLLSGGATRAELLASARNTGLADLADSLPMGYETLVSPGGGNFSGGQRQLIALTAALASSRKVLLLDEAMANLDTISKQRLLDSDLFCGKTVVLASHEDAKGEAGPERHGFRAIALESPGTHALPDGMEHNQGWRHE